MVDNFELSGTTEEQLETLEIVMSELKKRDASSEALLNIS